MSQGLFIGEVCGGGRKHVMSLGVGLAPHIRKGLSTSGGEHWRLRIGWTDPDNRLWVSGKVSHSQGGGREQTSGLFDDFRTAGGSGYDP